MNHIADANKMVSDTPRTDEQINGKPCTRFECLVGDSLRDALVPSQFARQLERELNAANDRIKRLEEFVDQLTNPKFTRDDLPKEALLQRIKRMEEAGDALKTAGYFGGWGDAVNKWVKVMEGQP